MASKQFKVEYAQISELVKDPENARDHTGDKVEKLAGLIDRFGYTNPILSDEMIRAGHGRTLACELIYARGDRVYLAPGKENGGQIIPKGTIPRIDCSGWSEDDRRAYNLADNQITIAGDWNSEKLKAQLETLRDREYDISSLGFGEDALAKLKTLGEKKPGKGAGSLAAEFLIPPFTVLSAREGWWQERKRQWLAMGIESEVGREANLLKMSDTMLEPDPEKRAAMKAPKDTRAVKTQQWVQDNIGDGGGLNANQSGTSIFDPVLCELAYRWFAPEGGTILDPFAGGSVRGIVAAKCGRDYLGIDLRQEQVAANEQQWADLKADGDGLPEWICGDSNAVLDDADITPEPIDFIFSCPPYGDLEVYSDIETDLSTMGDEEFLEAYRQIIAKSVARLEDDRFACFVIGDYRDKKGFYRNFVSRTIEAFEDAGARLYNEAILVTATGSLAIRAGKQFRTTRKLGKTHQNIVVFCKGDPRAAADNLGAVNVDAALDLISPEK